MVVKREAGDDGPDSQQRKEKQFSCRSCGSMLPSLLRIIARLLPCQFQGNGGRCVAANVFEFLAIGRIGRRLLEFHIFQSGPRVKRNL